MANGLTIEFGLGRDWRFRERAWWQHGMEYIAPLMAVGPAADARPVHNRLVSDDPPGYTWTIAPGNQNWRTSRSSGNPSVNWLEYDDSRVHSSYTAAIGKVSTSAQRLPRFSLNIFRYLPPQDQAVLPFTMAQTAAEYWSEQQDNWLPGIFTLYLPFASALRVQPLLHFISEVDAAATPTWYHNLFENGTILSQGPGDSVRHQGPHWLSFTVEYEEDGSLYKGSHILIREQSNPAEYWHTSRPDLRLKSGYWHILCAGARQMVNMSPLVYGETDEDDSGLGMYATPVAAMPLPTVTGSAWNADRDDTSWSGLSSTPSGWTVSVDANPDDQGNLFRPKIVCTRTQSGSWGVRPVVWAATEDHPAIIGNITLEGGDTQGNADLLSMSYTMSEDWRGAGGTARIRPQNAEAYSAWKENGRVTLNMGWESDEADPDLRAADIATCYIQAGGIRRQREGETWMGTPWVEADFGDFVATRMLQKDITDVRQAGGRTVTEWFTACANRMGLPTAMVDVDLTTAQANQVIPLNRLPSEPAFAPEDGQTWQTHLDTVCNALGLRWGVDKDASGKLFIDIGATTWEDGVSSVSHTIDYNTTTATDVVHQLFLEKSANELRNFIKVQVGRDTPEVGYVVQTTDLRKAGIGDDWSQVIQGDDWREAMGLVQAAFDRYGENAEIVKWTTIPRPGLRPDEFVVISDCPNMGITANSAYRITSHAISGEQAKHGESVFVMVKVGAYTP